MYMGSRNSGTASCAFSVVPAGLVSGLRSSSQDCVLRYSLSSLSGLVSGLRSVPGLTSWVILVRTFGTVSGLRSSPRTASWAILCRPSRDCFQG
jgi:hypothetical protein